MITNPPPGGDRVEGLRLRLERERLRRELAGWQARAAELERREARLAAEQASLRESRLASLNLIEDAVDAGNRMASANEALRAEVKARESAQAEALRERNLLRKVLDSLPGIFYLVDAEGHFLRWNRGFELISGYTGEEIAGMHPLDFFADAADRALLGARIRRVFADGLSELEAGFTAKDGSSTPYYFTGRRILIDGKPCLVGMGIDVSERRRTEAATRALELQLRESQKMEAVGTLAGGIAHDFNNLLTAILGNLYMVEQHLGPGSPMAPLVSDARVAGQRGAELVKQLLNYSRPNMDSTELIDLERLVQETTRLGQRGITPSISVVIERGEPGAMVAGNFGALQQVVLNLIVNARDAMPGGGRLTISTGLMEVNAWNARENLDARPGTYRVIAVSDTGTGMPPETMARIFDPFFTTKEVGKGTGLGLATSLSILRAHGGWMAVESRVGEGSTFRVMLPALSSE